MASRTRLLAVGTLLFGTLLAGCGGGLNGPGPIGVVATSSPTTVPLSTATPGTGSSATPAPGVTATPAAGSTATPIATMAPGATATPVSGSTATATPATSPPTTKPVVTPTPIAATPAPVATASSNLANDHPSTNGDVYDYTGSNVTVYTRPSQYPSPEPTQTVASTFAQAVTVVNPSTFDGDASAIDYHTVESDTQIAPIYQASSFDLDTYYAYTGTAYTGNFMELGWKSVDYTGATVLTTYAAGGVIADELPETAGASWTNPPTSTITTTVPSLESSTQTIHSDGSYTTALTYQQNLGIANTAQVVSNLDGSGSLSTPYIGSVLSGKSSFSVSAPSGGTITITEVIAPAAGSTSGPTTTTTSIASWIPTGFIGSSLIKESDTDAGPATIPASCKVPGSIGTSANAIAQTIDRVDPMLGQTEVTKTSDYVVPNFGTVCVQIDDLLTYYYDFSGQDTTIYDFSPSVQQTSELIQTLSLSKEMLQSQSRRGQLFAEMRLARPRVAGALNRIAAARSIERSRFLYSIAARRHFVASSSRSGGLL